MGFGQLQGNTRPYSGLGRRKRDADTRLLQGLAEYSSIDPPPHTSQGSAQHGSSSYCDQVGYPFDSGDHNILWLAIGGPRKGLPIAPRFQACDGHGACVILDRPETQPRGPIACRPASGAPGCILGAVCWRPWIDQTTTPRGYLSQVDTPLRSITTPAASARRFPQRVRRRRRPLARLTVRSNLEWPTS